MGVGTTGQLSSTIISFHLSFSLLSSFLLSSFLEVAFLTEAGAQGFGYTGWPVSLGKPLFLLPRAEITGALCVDTGGLYLGV